MRFFIEIPNLEEMERSQDWQKIHNYLLLLWQKDSKNAELIIRLVSECWIILEQNVIERQDEIFDFIKTIMQCYEKSLDLKYNSKLTFLFGYFMSLTPFYFYNAPDIDGKKYEEYELKGKILLEKAYKSSPNELIYKVAYLGSLSKPTKDYKQARQQLKMCLSNLFPGNTLIEEYFKDIFSLIA